MRRQLFALGRCERCAAAESKSPDFTKDVAPIFAKYCSGCHNDNDLEGELSLESFAKLQKGGEKGAVVVPNRADASLMIRVLTGEVEPAMPPKDEPQPTDAEINVLRAWIDAGAKGPDGAAVGLSGAVDAEDRAGRRRASIPDKPRAFARRQAACAGPISARGTGRSDDSQGHRQDERLARQGE